MAAPKLARAGKQAAQPIAEMTLPSTPVLSAMRVIKPMIAAPGSVAHCLTLDGSSASSVAWVSFCTLVLASSKVTTASLFS